MAQIIAKEPCKIFEEKFISLFIIKNNKINSDDIYGYLRVLLFMGIHYLPQLINYRENSSLYRNELPNYISKNQFKLLSCALHLPVGYLNPNILKMGIIEIIMIIQRNLKINL